MTVELLAGRTLSHFKVVSLLGRGGMGLVYRAEDVGLGRLVALKVLSPEAVADEDARRRLFREARIAARLVHPSIATVFEVGDTDGVVFIAMELIEGTTLRHRIEEGPLPIAEATRIATAIAEGLACAHAAGVVHRDLKPENVVIGKTGQVKILDFGLAKPFDAQPGANDTVDTPLRFPGPSDPGGDHRITRAGRVVGTAGYMSPEQAAGSPTDARTDVFSFGATLFEALTGRAAFTDRARSDPPPPPSSENAAVPAELDRVVARCLSVDPAGRYANGTELLAALGAVPASPATGPVDVPARSAAKPRAAWRPAALAVLALAAVGILFAWTTGAGPGEAGTARRSANQQASTATAPRERPVTEESGAARPPDERTRTSADPRAVTVESEPPGATLQVDGQVIGRTPTVVTIPAGADALAVEVAMAGHKGASLRVLRNGPASVSVRLERVRRLAKVPELAPR